MPARIDLSGQKFGKLTVVREVGKKRNRPLWECLCDCGGKVHSNAGELRIGKVTRCRKCADLSRVKHGCSHSRNQKVTREYKSWSSLRKRCNSPADKAYAYYGGRGIKVHPRWNDFRAFFADMGPCPKGHTLDRIDVNGNYEPSNCRWATVKQQQNNRRVNRREEYLGETKTTAEWADKYGVSLEYILNSLNSGYTLAEIIERRIQNGEKYKKIRFRGDNSAASKLTQEQVESLVKDYVAAPNVGCRKAPGTRGILAKKYGISVGLLGDIVGGRSNWTGRHCVGYAPRKS